MDDLHFKAPANPALVPPQARTGRASHKQMSGSCLLHGCVVSGRSPVYFDAHIWLTCASPLRTTGRKWIAAAVPQPLRQAVSARSLHAWGPIAPQPRNIDFTLIRRAIRDEEKLDLIYCDEQGRITWRVIRPLAHPLSRRPSHRRLVRNAPGYPQFPPRPDASLQWHRASLPP
jgi:hypothetical protein